MKTRKKWKCLTLATALLALSAAAQDKGDKARDTSSKDKSGEKTRDKDSRTREKEGPNVRAEPTGRNESGGAIKVDVIHF